MHEGDKRMSSYVLSYLIMFFTVAIFSSIPSLFLPAKAEVNRTKYLLS